MARQYDWERNIRARPGPKGITEIETLGGIEEEVGKRVMAQRGLLERVERIEDFLGHLADDRRVVTNKDPMNWSRFRNIVAIVGIGYGVSILSLLWLHFT